MERTEKIKVVLEVLQKTHYDGMCTENLSDVAETVVGAIENYEKKEMELTIQIPSGPRE